MSKVDAQDAATVHSSFRSRRSLISIARFAAASPSLSFTFGELPFQIRNAYILEMSPKVSGHEDVRTIVYIDSEAYVSLGAEFFAGNDQTEAAFPIWRSHRSPLGGYVFDFGGSFYVPLDQLIVHHLLGNDRSRLFFRSLVPAHCEFSQRINTGSVSLDLFDLEHLGTGPPDLKVP